MFSRHRRFIPFPSRPIHPHALSELGEHACIVALRVARDLRSGRIPPEEFNMRHLCGTPCCIAGHIALRLDIDQADYFGQIGNRAYSVLFSGHYPSNPQLAADAIERFIYDDSDHPWAAE